ncbi:MAG TPA: DUF883 family protein [Candidatus Dormibacteraeota bacterium]|nr:DUF883 family protein [Candidatus Dormibacteraeota bacterium]
MLSNETSNERVITDLKRVVRDSEELLKDSAAAIGEEAAQLREQLARSLTLAKSTYHRLEASAKARAKATDKAIREHPYQTIGIAFGLGMLIGVLLRRK